MKEILPGVFHWKTFHEGIQAYVHSYYINATDPAVLIDPRVPRQGIEWFATHGAPRHVYLTNRHHYRHSDLFAGRYGAHLLPRSAGESCRAWIDRLDGRVPRRVRRLVAWSQGWPRHSRRAGSSGIRRRTLCRTPLVRSEPEVKVPADVQRG